MFIYSPHDTTGYKQLWQQTYNDIYMDKVPVEFFIKVYYMIKNERNLDDLIGHIKWLVMFEASLIGKIILCFNK